MLKRFTFVLKSALRHRGALKELVKHQAKTLGEVDVAKIKADGVEVLVLDFDGVLASHGEMAPNEMGKALLDETQAIDGLSVVILSNKPLTARKWWFEQNYPSIEFITAKKKPYPDGLSQIAAGRCLIPNKLLLVDDRILTGGLAACLAKTQFIHITQPEIQWQKRPLKECGFWLLRKLENIFFSY